MPPICIQLKTICCLFTSFLSVFAFASDWSANDIFDSSKLNKKFSARDLDSSTKFYARATSYFSGQKWNEQHFLEKTKELSYRIRTADQVLMPGDAKKLDFAQCKNEHAGLFANAAPTDANFYCWEWVNFNSNRQLLQISSEDIINLSFQSQNNGQLYLSWKSELEPILLAQFKDSRPVLQRNLKIPEIPVNCLNAVMAIEDSEFLNHSGISYMGLTRSLFKNISQMRYAQGGSTITQQLVKNYFLSPEKTIKRKLAELYLAVKLESEWTKNQILETYLNVIYMGQWGSFQVLGFGAAADYYFNKPIGQLNLSQCALLAAIVNNPGKFNPWQKSEMAKNRRDHVLDKMLNLKLISNSELTEAKNASLPTAPLPRANETAPYFIEAVQSQLKKINLANLSLDVFTSLDLEAQLVAQNSLIKNISELEKNKLTIKKNREKGIKLEGLILSSENKTGLVTVLVGGHNYRQTQFNRALQSKRQIGSLIKPIVFLSALIKPIDPKNFTPLREISNQKFEWTFDNKKWTPENYDKTYSESVPMYYALKESLNIPTTRLSFEVGLSEIIKNAHSAGLTSKMENFPATSLGSSEHYPIEVLQTYQTLANFGLKTEPSFIEKIRDRDQKVIFELKPKFESTFPETPVAVLIGMMKETLVSGTAKLVKKLNWHHPSAGKTGTTSNNKDAWFVGFTKNHTTLVWLGYDQNQSSQLTGGGAAVPIWVDVMKYSSSTWPSEDFNFPENVEKRKVPPFKDDTEAELIFLKTTY